MPNTKPPCSARDLRSSAPARPPARFAGWLGVLLAGLLIAACQPAALPTPQAPTVQLARTPAVTNTIPSPAVSDSPWPTPTATPLAPGVVPTPTVDSPAIAPAPLLSSTAPLSPAVLPLTAPRVDGYRVIDSFPHDPSAYTQGLVYQDGLFYESTGLRGQSTLRKVDPATGHVVQGVRLPDQYFGEGIAVLGDRLYQLTWQENTGFIYAKDTFELLDAWRYPTEGWGLTTDGQRLIMSDGTAALTFLDPATLEVQRTVQVFDEQGPVLRLNELEWVEGEVWANVWQTDLIARIDPDSGRVTGWVDLSGLLPPEDRTQPVDVLNGIAYDAATGRLFVTGKLWPKVFEIEVVVAP